MRKSHLPIFYFLVVLLAACVPQAVPTEVIAPTPTPVPFKFGPQTADEAQELLTQAEKTVLEIGHYADYRSQIYHVAEYAAWDALHRFPDDLRAATWKWKFAYYAALAGDSEAANGIYMDLITNALNEKNITVADLPLWFQSGESIKDNSLTMPFILTVIDFSGKQKDQKYLIRLGPEYSEASCYLISRTSNEYSVFIVYDSFSAGYNLMTRNNTSCELDDLTNDDMEDVVVRSYYGGHAYATTAIRIFEVSSLPPTPLSFNIISAYNDKFALYDTDKDYPSVNGKSRIRQTDYISNCSARIIQDFEWNGVEFASVNVNLQLDKREVPVEECGYRILSQTEYLNSIDDRVRILDEAVKFFETVAADDQELQVLDRLRIEKGLIYLFENQPDQTRQAFQEILQDPYQKDGIWQKPIQNFLDQYKSQKDIYRACSALTACDANTSISSALSCGVAVNLCASDVLGDIFENEISLSSFDTLLEDLKSWGVEIAEQGRIDLDLDGKDELWFTIALPESQYYEYLLRWVYVASDYPNGVRIFQTGNFANNVPPDFKIEQMDENRFYVKYWEHGNFVWSRDSITNEPIFLDSSHFFEDSSAVERILKEDAVRQSLGLREKILTGNDINNIYNEYQGVKKKYDGACPDLHDIVTLEYNCGTYYFEFGFAAELAGDEQTAREMYVTVAEQYPDHPMALLARNKLGK